MQAEGATEAGGAIQLGEDEAIETEEETGEGERGAKTACRGLVHRQHKQRMEAFLCLLSRWAWQTQLAAAAAAAAGAKAVATPRVAAGQPQNRSSVVREAVPTIR